jgi:hypothetical protein
MLNIFVRQKQHHARTETSVSDSQKAFLRVEFHVVVVLTSSLEPVLQ